MPEEIQSQKNQENTVATVGMVFSIIGLIALITVFFARLGLPLLFVGFILGIIGLFNKPRGKARVAISIPLIVFIALTSVVCYIWSSIKTPAKEFGEWAKVQLEQLNEESFDNDRFNNITNEEFNNIFSSMTEEDLKTLIENSTGSNILEKGSYVIFGLLQQGFENSLERYNNGEMPEISDTSDEESDNDTNDNEDNDNEEIIEQEKIEIEEPSQENKETFSQSEKNDIEQILNILE